MPALTITSVVLCILSLVSTQTVQPPATDPIFNFCDTKIAQFGEGYFRIPGYCNIFVHCNSKTKPELQTCASGTFFDGFGCSHASTVTCDDDPCKKLPEGQRFSDGGNCFGYYECRAAKAYYEHCPRGEAFNITACMPDSTCIHPVISTRVELPGCPSHIAADSGDNTKYFVSDGGAVQHMSCPSGLVFSPDVCICNWPDSSLATATKIAAACASIFTFSFSGDFQEEQKRVYMSNVGNVFIQNGRAYIDNQGTLVIPYMDNVQLGSDFALQFTFKYGGNATDNVTILTNQDQYYAYTYNIELRPLNQEVRVDLVLTDGSTASLTAINVNPSFEHTLRLGKTGDEIQLQIDNAPPVLVLAQAGLAPQSSSMTIGTTVNGNPFIGYVDDIALYRCQPDLFYS